MEFTGASAIAVGIVVVALLAGVYYSRKRKNQVWMDQADAGALDIDNAESNKELSDSQQSVDDWAKKQRE